MEKNRLKLSGLEEELKSYTEEGLCIVPTTPTTHSKDPPSFTSNRGGYSPVPGSGNPNIGNNESIAKLNTQLLHVLDQNHEYEIKNQKLSREIEELHRNVGVNRHQLGLVYEEYENRQKEWLDEKTKIEKAKLEMEEVSESYRIKYEEIESHLKSLDDEKKIAETARRIAILKSNEAILIRRFNAVVDNEEILKRENLKLKNEIMSMESEIKSKLGFLSRHKEMSSYKIEALQKSLNESVPMSELEAANRQYSELTEKYRDLLQRETFLSGNSRQIEEMELNLESLRNEKNQLNEELTLAKEKLYSMENIIASLRGSNSNNFNQDTFR